MRHTVQDFIIREGAIRGVVIFRMEKLLGLVQALGVKIVFERYTPMQKDMVVKPHGKAKEYSGKC